MHILISGGSGFVGSHLASYFKGLGHRVSTIARGQAILPPAFDVLIHLSGANIAEKAWTDAYKRELYRSRIESTERLARELAKLASPPKVFICASAVGFYGDRGAELLSEDCSPGEGFLSALCQAWEEASLCKNSKIRVVNARFGAILGKNGGILQKILPIFRFCLGGNLGSGEQYVSWIALEDLQRALLHVIEHDNISGPVNFVAPHPVKNKDFTRILAKTLHRPAFFHAPAVLLRIMFGKEKTQELFLSSCRAIPEKLLQTGFQFKCNDLEQALEELFETY